MMPDNVLSTAAPGNWMPPDDRETDIVSLEYGALELYDTSSPLQSQVWEYRIKPDGIWLAKEGEVGELIWPGTNITEVSGTFDNLMAPTFAWVEGGLSRFRWYDSTQGVFVVTDMPGLITPRVTMDDKRLYQDDVRDVLLFAARYDEQTRTSYLSHWIQRDRYGVEYFLAEYSGLMKLGRVGMNTAARIQIEVLRPAACPGGPTGVPGEPPNVDFGTGWDGNPTTPVIPVPPTPPVNDPCET